ncbi:MAG: bifunctional precorrin-2 dehydrogenase/sirohydrochlorin ferrochelatase [Desulfuromonadales bacterium]|nr:bifunctional precorrin-2 dehydrogenase/sirohydrochlorin ferrochelatase [Desulfuromonadales bacterium]
MASDPTVSGYPIIFDLTDRLCVVVGAGSVGCRKARDLLTAGARVRLVSTTPPFDNSLSNQVDLQIKAFEPNDLDNAVLAFAATGTDQVDREVCAAAKARSIPINCAASPADGDFQLPATLRRGDLLLAVATNGRSPALARALRDRLAGDFGPEWADIVEILGRLRTRKLTDKCEKTYSYKVLDKLLASGLAEHVAAGHTTEVNTLLARILDEAISLEDLGLALRDISS